MNIPSFIYMQDIMYEVKGTTPEPCTMSIEELFVKYEGEKAFRKDGQLYIVVPVQDAVFEDIVEQKVLENKKKEK